MLDKHNWLTWVLVAFVVIIVSVLAVRIVRDMYEAPKTGSTDLYSTIMQDAIDESKVK